MTSPGPLRITAFERRYHQAVDDLIFQNYQVHTHLDWYEPLDWLERARPTVRLAWQGERLAGMLAASAPLSGVVWLRIAALHDHAPAHTVMNALWQALLPELQHPGVQRIALLITRSWIHRYIQALGFTFTEDIITLERRGALLPDLPEIDAALRRLQPADIDQVLAIDQAAFPDSWQMSIEELRQATRTAAICTVAVAENQVVGYQISTTHRDGAHVARLAVDPQRQGQHIGSALLHDVLRQFIQQQITTITVNTQAGNLRSQRLYRNFGFQRNGYDLPVWSLTVAAR
jgi:ribosomal-protein-alanine N-acetyltransferase